MAHVVPRVKFIKVEVDDVELEYPTEENLSIEKIFSETNLYGQQNLIDVLNFIKNNASITNYLASSENTVTTNVGNWVNIPGLSLTPTISGTYIVMCFVLCSHSLNNGLGNFALAKNGVRETTTISPFTFASKNSTNVVPFIKTISINGTTDTITAQWDDANGSLTATNRYLFMLRVV